MANKIQTFKDFCDLEGINVTDIDKSDLQNDVKNDTKLANRCVRYSDYTYGSFNLQESVDFIEKTNNGNPSNVLCWGFYKEVVIPKLAVKSPAEAITIYDNNNNLIDTIITDTVQVTFYYWDDSDNCVKYGASASWLSNKAAGNLTVSYPPSKYINYDYVSISFQNIRESYYTDTPYGRQGKFTAVLEIKDTDGNYKNCVNYFNTYSTGHESGSNFNIALKYIESKKLSQLGVRINSNMSLFDYRLILYLM